jgi:hypothetical protein
VVVFLESAVSPTAFAEMGSYEGAANLCCDPCSFPARSLILSLLRKRDFGAKFLRTRAVSGFQSNERGGDARITLLISLFMGIWLETG